VSVNTKLATGTFIVRVTTTHLLLVTLFCSCHQAAKVPARFCPEKHNLAFMASVKTWKCAGSVALFLSRMGQSLM
jgi:hypothetical protein